MMYFFVVLLFREDTTVKQFIFVHKNEWLALAAVNVVTVLTAPAVFRCQELFLYIM